MKTILSIILITIVTPVYCSDLRNEIVNDKITRAEAIKYCKKLQVERSLSDREVLTCMMESLNKKIPVEKKKERSLMM